MSYGSTAAAADDDSTMIIGVVIDEASRVGKEHKAAMKIAVQKFNNSSDHKLIIHFRNIAAGNPFKAATAADQLIRVERVQVLIISLAWQEASVVANVGNRAKVAVIPLGPSAISPTLAHVRWPFVIQMASNSSNEMESVAAIVHSYNWRKVVVIYEEDTYGDPGTLAVLSQALQQKGSEIEYSLVLPPYFSLSDPQFIDNQVAKLQSRNSRVYIMLISSVRMAKHLFREAKRTGLMGRDSVWIVTDSITSVLDSRDFSFMKFMKGAIGTKTYYSEKTSSFKELKAQFREIMKVDYPEEDNLVPGVHALRAYDSIMAISQAVTRLGSHEKITSKKLLKEILQSNFLGLSGNIRFHSGSLLDSSTLGIINIVGKGYKELGFWSPELGFLKNVTQVNGGSGSLKTLDPAVDWPGDLPRLRDPRGWTMASKTKPMRIGVPGKASFRKFVRVKSGNSSDISGFCIDVFTEVVKFLEKKYYRLYYEFIPFNGTYDELVFNVTEHSNQAFDAVVGDITILENRSKYVDFTQPYAESGLSMTVPYNHEPSKAWLFLKPFSCREKVYSSFTKTVVVVWLFVVLVLTSSYTASLSSMLTVQRLEPKVKDIEWLRKKNAPVGCDGDSFVKDYLRDVLNLHHIKNISNETAYPSEFDKGNISASFLELPYQKVFLQDYCNKYTTVGPTYRFGGLGFVFQKGSPIARDVSEAILNISENGVLRGLEKTWFPSATNCSASSDNLTIESFWGIYLISGVTSTVCLLIFIAKLLVFGEKKDRNETNQETGDIAAEEGNWRKAIALVRYVKYVHDNKISPVRAMLFSLLMFLL
ncbi:hypothetical protein AgCh_040019 [Apium graveolens]